MRRIAHQHMFGGEIPRRVLRFDVDLDEGLPRRVEQVAIFPRRIGRPSLVPIASTRSASATAAFAAGVPKVPNTPSAKGCVSAKRPLPAAVVTTGSPAASASATSASYPWAIRTPLPAMMTGRSAASSAFGGGLDAGGIGRRRCGRQIVPRRIQARLAIRLDVAAETESSANSTATGPGCPAVACLIASCVACTAATGVCACITCLVTPLNARRASQLP